ncbi:MAG: prenyltransferase/squalene oxidase repeat-containing protein [Gemmataceae bacterium]
MIRNPLLFSVSLLIALSCSCGVRAEAPAKTEKKREAKLHPKASPPLPPEKLDSAIRAGIAFLLKDQNKNGSWGSAQHTKDLNIYAPVPGAHHAFRAAVTALCVAALIEVDDGSESVRKAIECGEDYLFAELPKVRRAEPMAIYNVWAHGYGIQALARMHQRQPEDKERRKKIEDLIRTQYDYLTRYESAKGGWAYYDFGAGTQRPDSSAASFVSAAILVAFHDAKEIGVPPPEKILKRGVESVQRQRKPDFSYLYDDDLRYVPMMPINRPGGSLGRSQACNLALRLWGDKRVTDDVLKTWLDRLITRNGWLDMGRKRPIPHESHFQVAGYFFYFGHYYAALCIEQLKAEERPFYQDHLARILLALQEKDGSWWDYPLYNYHRQYGTAFALMALRRCRKAELGRPR